MTERTHYAALDLLYPIIPLVQGGENWLNIPQTADETDFRELHS